MKLPSKDDWEIKVSITGVQKAIKWYRDRKIKKKENVIWVVVMTD